MLDLYILLYCEYLKIGAFSVGGGYATLPFLFHLQSHYGWYSLNELTNMIAVSNVTPGAIGVNMATYTGYTTAGIIGSVIATTGIISAPFIFSVILIKLFNKYKSLPIINSIFLGLRPAACALLAVVAIKLLKESVLHNFAFDYKALVLFLLLMIPFSFFKKNPILTILTGALGGVLINL